jgi:hypothetical protein
MNAKWIAIILCFLLIGSLYLIEIGRIQYSGDPNITNLDTIDFDKTASAWEPFYRVRATLIDGQSARFIFPKELLAKKGQEIELHGAAVFFGNGCSRKGDIVTISRFYLVPTLGLAQACEIQPDEEMRWTIQVHLKDPWILHYDDMVNAIASVKGQFRIDESKPYEGVFFLDNAVAAIVVTEE